MLLYQTYINWFNLGDMFKCKSLLYYGKILNYSLVYKWSEITWKKEKILSKLVVQIKNILIGICYILLLGLTLGTFGQ